MMQCLQGIMRNVWMCVTSYDQLSSNLSIDKNLNWVDYPSIFIVALSFFLYVQSLFCKP
jgi:hypothetical protein